jgi:membrane protein
MRTRFRTATVATVDFFRKLAADDVFTGAAALAYYFLFAIFPGAIFLLTLIPYLPIPHLHQSVMAAMGQFLPGDAAQLFEGVISEVTLHKREGLLSFGLILSWWSASSGVAAVMNQLNIVYGLKESRPFWKARLVAVLLTLALTLLVLVAFGLIIFGGAIQAAFENSRLMKILGAPPIIPLLFVMFRWLVVGCFLLTAFALVYRFGPDLGGKFSLLSYGSVLGSGVLIAASLGFRLYVARFANYSASYGSLGAVIVLMLWLYIAGLIVLVGGALNAWLASSEGARATLKKTGAALGLFSARY